MASLDDILTAQKNGVVAINGVSQTNLRSMGTVTSQTVQGNTVIFAGKGYLVNFSVVVAGTTEGTIYNAGSIAAVDPANALCTTTTTLGIYKCGQVFTNGLVVEPGAGQSINVTYSVG